VEVSVCGTAQAAMVKLVTFSVVLLVTAVTVMVAAPPVNTLVADVPPLILYVTVAPLVPVRLNTAFCPSHIGELLLLIETVGAANTVVTILLLVAGFPDAQGVILDVSSTVTSSPFASDVVVKVEAVSPETSTPFTFHW
jgi:hypothetical protein